MPSFGAYYHRRSAPDHVAGSWAYFSVRTNTFFREYQLPERERDMTPAHRRQYDELAELAECLGTNIMRSAVRLG